MIQHVLMSLFVLHLTHSFLLLCWCCLGLSEKELEDLRAELDWSDRKAGSGAKEEWQELCSCLPFLWVVLDIYQDKEGSAATNNAVIWLRWAKSQWWPSQARKESIHEMFIVGRVELYVQNGEPYFLANLKR